MVLRLAVGRSKKRKKELGRESKKRRGGFKKEDKGFCFWGQFEKKGRELFWVCLPRVDKESTLALVSLE